MRLRTEGYRIIRYLDQPLKKELIGSSQISGQVNLPKRIKKRVIDEPIWKR